MQASREQEAPRRRACATQVRQAPRHHLHSGHLNGAFTTSVSLSIRNQLLIIPRTHARMHAYTRKSYMRTLTTICDELLHHFERPGEVRIVTNHVHLARHHRRLQTEALSEGLRSQEVDPAHASTVGSQRKATAGTHAPIVDIG
jgi:hypothetical protein